MGGCHYRMNALPSFQPPHTPAKNPSPFPERGRKKTHVVIKLSLPRIAGGRGGSGKCWWKGHARFRRGRCAEDDWGVESLSQCEAVSLPVSAAEARIGEASSFLCLLEAPRKERKNARNRGGGAMQLAEPPAKRCPPPAPSRARDPNKAEAAAGEKKIIDTRAR